MKKPSASPAGDPTSFHRNPVVGRSIGAQTIGLPPMLAVFLVVLAIGLAGCQSPWDNSVPHETPAQAEARARAEAEAQARVQPTSRMPPAPLPDYRVGDTFFFDSNGLRRKVVVRRVTDNTIVWESDDGVVWTTQANVITPPVRWSNNPDLGRGTQVILGNPEDIFPLEVGRRVAFRVNGRSERDPLGWRDEQTCAVTAQKRVTVQAGTFDTFRIDCGGDARSEILYYSPLVRNVILREGKPFIGQDLTELVSYRLKQRPLPSQGVIETAAAPVPANPVMAAPDYGSNYGGSSYGAEYDSGYPSGTMPMTGTPNIVPGIGGPQAFGGVPVRQITPLRPRAAPPEMLSRMQPGGGAGAMASPASAAPAANGRYAVHLASYRSLTTLNKGWRLLKKKYRSELKDLSPEPKQVDLGAKGEWYRLLGVSLATKNAANDICRQLKSRKQFCKVVKRN